MDIAILGSTGSIGVQTLDVCRRFPDRLRPLVLAGGRNTALLERQVLEFRPRYVASALPLDPHVLAEAGAELVTLEEAAAIPGVERVMLATTGRAGLAPAWAALAAGIDLVVANKEVLVMAGGLVVREAARTGARLLPVDSEHNAVWQCLAGDVADYRDAREVEMVYLTASGGAFRNLAAEELAHVTVEQALRHPTWVMGPKVTIDSATLMNKGFEVIETHWLFGIPWERIGIVLHRESIVHSMVQFGDGAIKAQLSPPDMRLPIQYGLSWPERWENPELPRMDFSRPLDLHFGPPSLGRYPCLRLAVEAGRRGGSWPVVLAAADEWAVDAFIAGRIRFDQIPQVIERALDAHVPPPAAPASVEDVLAIDAEVTGRLERDLAGTAA